uniref:bcl-2-like protein 13 isoform X1 n=2 Tax=Myxine glutinosa TaxID=7769 RepID=UPI0035902A69
MLSDAKSLVAIFCSTEDDIPSLNTSNRRKAETTFSSSRLSRPFLEGVHIAGMETSHTEGPSVPTPGESADAETSVRESQPQFEAAVELPTEGGDAVKSLETTAQDLQPTEHGAFGGNNAGETSISTSWQEVSEPPSMENTGEESVGPAEETVIESGIGRSVEEQSENSSSSNSDLVHVEKEEIPEVEQHSSEGKTRATPFSPLKPEGAFDTVSGENVLSKDDAEIPLEAGDPTQDAKGDKTHEGFSLLGKSGLEMEDKSKPATPAAGTSSDPILPPASPAAAKDGTSFPGCSMLKALMLGGGTLMLLATIALVLRRVRV